MRTIRKAVLTALAVAACGAVSAQTARIALDIKPQPMRAALKALGEQAGLQILFRAEDVAAGGAAPAVIGQLSIEDALEKLLTSSGLRYEFVNERTVRIAAKQSVSTSGVMSSTALGQEDDSWSRFLLAQSDSSPSSSLTSSDGEGTAGQAAKEGRGESERLEEVIVTARKTKERLQDVPLTVTAITGEQLKSIGAVDLKDVLRSVPGLSFSNVERGQSRYNIRGVATTAPSPTVGIYMDDISLVTQSGVPSGAFDAVFFDLERLEVLKGPQGTLYGGSSMGGAIKYVSARPDLTSLTSSVAAGIGTTEHGAESYNADGVVNFPVIDGVLAVRGGISYRREGGYVDNIAGGSIENTAYSSTALPTYTPLIRPSLSTQSKKDYNPSDTYVGRLSLLWRPDASWSIRPAVIYQDSKAEAPPLTFTNLDGLTSSYRLLDQQTSDRGGIYSLDVNKTMSAVELTSLTAYFDRNLQWDRDYSFFIGGLVPGLYNLNSLADYRVRTKNLSQELRISSAAGSDSRWTWLAGLYYRSQDQTANSVVTTPGANFADDVAAANRVISTLDESAAFGEVSFKVTSALNFTAGVRLFEVRQDSASSGAGPLNGGSTFISAKTKADGVNPKAGLSYRLSEDRLLYASAAKGFRPGGLREAQVPTACAGNLAQLGLTTAPASYDPDSLWTYELGSKNEFGGGRFMMNGAVFYTDWKDIQQQIRLPNCGFIFTANVGAARVQGAELETRVNVTPALQIGGNATFTDAEITDPGSDFSAAKKGDEVQDVPKWMASAFGILNIPVFEAWDLSIRADYQYRNEARRQFVTTQSVKLPVNGTYPTGGPTTLVPYAAVFQEGYEVVNASFALTNGGTTVRLFVSNALDAQPSMDSRLDIGSSRTTTLRPRTFGIEVRQAF